MLAFHGTTEKSAKAIIAKGFKLPKYAGDLGRGAYGYIDTPDKPYFDTAISNAKKYAYREAHKVDQGICVIQFEVQINEHGNEVLNFNDPDTVDKYQRLVANTRKAVEKEKPRRFKRAKRKQDDGYILEWEIAHGFVEDAVVVIMDTHTDFKAIRGNFPNGREACVRKIECIAGYKMLDLNQGGISDVKS
ncbi:hypothetical protein EFO83_05880 [Lacticaseibacillus rhamnosus]|uniref:hypothetical protein n=1 Tax=Lacticaseibacillus rhamnosus TaxID=47715 RepID=UPI0021A7C42B|nr:hypothetical protein [Lacticaseibacillus rhamnosus]MCT3191570.1 hypothetical protein [Lacticaseibacillus rhamnosus]MCT3372453.1 hypothetical protein [Lacticaseibacillus rhamnosus]